MMSPWIQSPRILVELQSINSESPEDNISVCGRLANLFPRDYLKRCFSKLYIGLSACATAYCKTNEVLISVCLCLLGMFLF